MNPFLTVFLVLFTRSLFATTTPLEAFAMVQNQTAVFVDVREAQEIKLGMIKGAKWFPLSRLQQGGEWKKDFRSLTAGKRIFLYCRSGNRSGQVQEILKKSGIQAMNLGGFEELRALLPGERP